MSRIIFHNATVITMDEKNPFAEAILIEDGKILKVGTNKDILAHKTPETLVRDLRGKTVLPGLIDPHSHFTAVAYDLLMVNAKPSPSGRCDTKDFLLEEFRKAYRDGDWSDGEWLMGMGYDPSAFPDKVGITRLDLDTVSDQVPISCIHSSGHMAVMNTLAMKLLGYWGDFAVPQGGTVERLSDGTPSGLVTELAYLSPEVQKKIKAPAFSKVMESLKNTSSLYASYGITTAQDARVKAGEYQLLTQGASLGSVFIDVVGIVSPECAGEILVKGETAGEYVNHIRMGGVKIFLDGSPQGKTAWLSEPYLVPPEGYDATYCGFPICEDEAVVEIAKRCLENSWQLNVHCNGDRASEQMIACYEKAVEETGLNKDLRPVMIHAQTLRRDQIGRMAKLGMTVSFFLDHVYYWGDWHYESVLGAPRAENISPISWAMKAGISCTVHQDSPVVPPNMMLALHNAVNRKTMSGRVLGEGQRISVTDALKALTRNGAYQIFEEDKKGSIEAGKLADLVILGENPYLTPKEKLKDIPVLETVKEGKTVYRNPLEESL